MPDAPRWLERLPPLPTRTQRAHCCGPECKRASDDCMAHTYGRNIEERALAAGFLVVEIPKQ
jgi:hypothetical protein